MIKNRIQFVTALHGDERAPVLALASRNIEQIVANTAALAVGKRFIDMDMNKAFGTQGNTLEEIRAREVIKLIDPKSLIVDFHSTSAKTQPFAIIVDLKMLPFVSTIGLRHVVYMKHNIKSGHSLIDHCNGVSVETGIHDTSESFQTTLSVVDKAKNGVSSDIELYEVTGIIDKPGEYINFRKHKDGFFPVLAGEKAYDFFGLKAQRLTIDHSRDNVRAN